MVLSALPTDLNVAHFASTPSHPPFSRGPHKKLRQSEQLGLIDDGTLKKQFSGRFSFLQASALGATSVSGPVPPMLLVVHNVVGPVVMLLLPVPIDEHAWSQVSVCALQTRLSMPEPAMSPYCSSQPTQFPARLSMAERFPSSNRRILDLSGHGRGGTLELGPRHLVQRSRPSVSTIFQSPHPAMVSPSRFNASRSGCRLYPTCAFKSPPTTTQHRDGAACTILSARSYNLSVAQSPSGGG